jgi:hypothetical protein
MASSVTGVFLLVVFEKVVKEAARLAQEFVIGSRAGPGAGEDGLDTGGFRHGHPAHIQKMHDGGDSAQAGSSARPKLAARTSKVTRPST